MNRRNPSRHPYSPSASPIAESPPPPRPRPTQTPTPQGVAPISSFSPGQVATLEGAYQRFGASYKAVSGDVRASLVSETGLDVNEIKRWWMTRARQERHFRSRAASASDLATPPTPAPTLSRSISVPSSSSTIFPPPTPGLKRSLSVRLAHPSSTPRQPLAALPSSSSDDPPYIPPAAKKHKKSNVVTLTRRHASASAVAEGKQPETTPAVRRSRSAVGTEEKGAKEAERKRLEEERLQKLVDLDELMAYDDLMYEELRASVGEEDGVVFFQASSLRAGSWERKVDLVLPDLRVYYSPQKAAICFWTSNEPLDAASPECTFSTRITLPILSLTSIKLFYDPLAHDAFIFFTRDPAAPLYFHAAHTPSQPRTPATWISVPSDFTPGSQASTNDVFCVCVHDSDHAWSRLVEIPLMLDPVAGDAFRGKLWTAEWPVLGLLPGAEKRMRVGDVLRCLEGVPCRTEWGNGEMVAFWYGTGAGGKPVEIRRRFVLPPPMPMPVDEKGNGKEVVVDWSSWVYEEKIDEGTAEEEGGGGIKVFEDFEDSKGIGPFNFYLTPPPEGSRHAGWKTSILDDLRVAQGSTSDSAPPPPSSQPLSSSSSPSASQESSATSLGYGYVDEWEGDGLGTTTFFTRSSSKSPSPEFDYTMNISEAFAFWQDPPSF